jgi:hypothetical protein
MATIETYYITGHVIDISDPQKRRGVQEAHVELLSAISARLFNIGRKIINAT